MSSDDLKAHAASDQDFYALLDVSPAATLSEIKRQYRRTALKYHPDKISNPTPADIDKFHTLQIAHDVLTDPDVKQLYDNAREARLRKQRERDMLDSARRSMVEDLEKRERAGAAAQRGVKRSWMEENDAEAKLAAEIERIAQDGRRRRKEAQEKLQRELDEEQKVIEREEEEKRKAADRSSQRVDRSQETNVSELERSVKVRWVREGRGMELEAEGLRSLFAPFGAVEAVVILKDKRKKVEGKKGKVTLATGMIVFTSIVSAHAAVLDGEKKIRSADGDWAIIDSVSWASGDGPNLGAAAGSVPSKAQASDPSTSTTDTSKSAAAPAFNFPGLNSAPNSSKAPSFGSFGSAAASMKPKASPFNASARPAGMPSFQDEILMKMKAAQREKERKALEEELAREDEAADAAEASTKANGA
ncbi:uncharacterized protein N7484_009439 [Penicillium longicatenatum]|uniref:uncharacterized protein n=1 Tax=Penicillium longicatenatum TaxID=1561947 RepID=UPI0025490B86|nr:uncharacterized protein N7484_009439 [Penicillium longicatenatum]KAJ5636126.1 hypothetical protein N7484_009439 [Penicillium longicatenatum]